MADNSKPARTCDVDECDRRHLARGYCILHYNRWQRYGDPNGGNSFHTRGEAEKWLENHLAAGNWPTLKCIEWPYAKFASGYAQIAIFRGNKKETVVSRIVCAGIHGDPPTPDHIWALHQANVCHNKVCVNPHHVRWGTPQENADDRRLDRTVLKGEAHGGSVLTRREVEQIRTDPRRHKEIAAEYGIARQSVSRIKLRKQWKHVP